jgi:hypothetical protein
MKKTVECDPFQDITLDNDDEIVIDIRQAGNYILITKSKLPTLISALSEFLPQNSINLTDKM